MSLRCGMSRLLAVGVVLALLRQLLFLELLITDPATLVEAIGRRVVVREWTAAEVLPMIENGTYQPVDLRRDSALPIIGNRLAWSLPLPHSMTILARYRDNATAQRLAFIVTEKERDEGLQMLQKICKELHLGEAVLVVGGL